MLDADQPLAVKPEGASPLISRRQLLLGFAGSAFGVVTVAACRSGSGSAADAVKTTGSPPPSPSTRPLRSGAAPQPSPTAPAVVARVVGSEETLIAAYDAAAAAHPGLVPLIATLRGHHVQHLHALDPTTQVPGPASAPSTSAPVSGSAVSSPQTAADTLAGLASLETAAAAACLDEAAQASGSLARLIASIGGCEASHVVALGSP
jgi:hypothetical protein